MRTLRRAGYDDRIQATCIRPPPAQVIYMYMQMAHARRSADGALAKDGYNSQILDPPLDPDETLGQAGRRLVRDFDVR